VLALALLVWLACTSHAVALIFVSQEFEPPTVVPPDFPYWENVTQRRYEGPSVIYLGGGWALTARHVGMGEILLSDGVYMPLVRSRHTLMNENGTGADAMIFELDPSAEIPDLPILPIASAPLQVGEEVLVIGFGRERAKVSVWHADGEPYFGFEWSANGAKRWGTNRITAVGELLAHQGSRTHVFAFQFDEPHSDQMTLYEAQAATGDSGGGVFVKRNDEWLLAGMMVSVTGKSQTPHKAATYGDFTYAADMSAYRDEIMRWARPSCSNEADDDGDGRFDFPADAGCESASDRDERDPTFITTGQAWALGLGTLGLIVAWTRLRRQRGVSTPISTSPSSAD
jgi:hypothetical protein